LTTIKCRRFGNSLSFAIVAAGVAAAIVGTASAQNWSPTESDIARLEAGIKLEAIPRWDKRLPSLSGYARYYAGSTANGEQVIDGELVVPVGAAAYKPGIHILQSKQRFPMIFDGGCAVIHLVYSVRQQRITSIRCNGFA